MNRGLLFVVNEASFFLSHRLPLAVAARKEGYRVHVATRPGDSVNRLVELGFEHHSLAISRSGGNPLAEIRSALALLALFRRIKPAIVHLVTIKPVLYGGIAARLAGISAVVAAISGLGFVFSGSSWRAQILRPLVTALYRLALNHRNLRVIFQNPTDKQVFMGLGLVDECRTTLIPGSGVDLSEYSSSPEPAGVITVVLAARLLRDKGVIEFVHAARQLRCEGMQARFLLVGEPDPGNPSSVTSDDIAGWKLEGNVEFLGFRQDIPALFSKSHIVALPSYGEGLPKVLAEAAACGRPIVTTDCPGCRDAIEPDVTGLLVPPRNAPALAAAIRRLIEDPALRQSMGSAGRRLAERVYSIEMIVESHIGIYRALLAERQ